MSEDLINFGNTLAHELEAKALELHVKSSAHECFSWEAIGVRNRIESLKISDTKSRSDIKYKDVEWGLEIKEYSPELSKAVAEFYRKFYIF